MKTSLFARIFPNIAEGHSYDNIEENLAPKDAPVWPVPKKVWVIKPHGIENSSLVDQISLAAMRKVALKTAHVEFQILT